MSELAEGLELGARFVLLRRLGLGGMGEVWLARDNDADDSAADELVALKILGHEFADDTAFATLLKAECKKTKQLVHPGIIRVHDFYAAAGQPFISMQYIDGVSLATLRGASSATILQTMLSVAEALEYAHKAGLIHRDVKAANILLDQNSNPVLTDFGIAAALDSPEYLAVLKTGGSLPAMSPQQLAGEAPDVTDDVYALGSLMYELLSGFPLFHPEATADQVRDEIPARLEHNYAGEVLPKSLGDLIAAMLDKSAARRPQGMRAVIAMLESCIAELAVDTTSGSSATAADTIQIVSRGAAQPGLAASQISRKSSRPAATMSGPLVWSAVGALLLATLGVVLWLPAYIESQSPDPEVSARERMLERRRAELLATESVAAAVDSGSRELADAALGDLLQMEDDLRAKAVERWGGQDWAAALDFVNDGDEAYKRGDFTRAVSAYQDALAQLRPLDSRVDEVLNDALADGLAALEAGNRAMAVERFELALAIDASNAAAKQALQRALQLDKVLELMTAAAAAETQSQWDAALAAYDDVIGLDPQWTAAQEGRQRVQAIVREQNYQAAMSAGYAAVAAESYSQAAQAFEKALRARPGDRDASAALAQIKTDQRQSELVRAVAAARTLEIKELWLEAVQKYQVIIDRDSSVTVAREGLARSRKRAGLAASLEHELDNTTRLNQEPVWQAAQALLQQARGIDAPGPRHSAQIEALAQALEIAAQPVPVVFESDNLTEVVIYKVGSLGVFARRTLELRPGAYVAVGSRAGFRDVRRDFLVQGDGETPPIDVRCKETI